MDLLREGKDKGTGAWLMGAAHGRQGGVSHRVLPHAGLTLGWSRKQCGFAARQEISCPKLGGCQVLVVHMLFTRHE